MAKRTKSLIQESKFLLVETLAEETIKMIFKENNNYLSLGTLENGISIRFLGTSSQDARKCFFSIWTQIRTVCGFCKPEYQGVWPLQDL